MRGLPQDNMRSVELMHMLVERKLARRNYQHLCTGSPVFQATFSPTQSVGGVTKNAKRTLSLLVFTRIFI